MRPVTAEERYLQPEQRPKVIHIGRCTYIACCGVLTVHSPREGPYDNNPGTSEVLYQDPQGVRHHLIKVRSVTVTPFAGDPRICANPAP